MSRIAVISDVHGNLEALKAVLADIKKRHVDKIICLGDVLAKGAHFSECIKLIQDNCDVVLQGNCDWYFTNAQAHNDELQDMRIKYNRSSITDEEIEYLKNLPYCYEMKVSGSLFRFFHATPNKIYGYVGDSLSPEHYEMFLPSPNTVSQEVADVVVYGHIHKSYKAHLYNRTIINVGSAGNNFEVYRHYDKDGDYRCVTRANYLIINGDIDTDEIASISYEFIELMYNNIKELEDSKDCFEYDGLKSELKYGLYRDLESIKDSLESRGLDIDHIKKYND